MLLTHTKRGRIRSQAPHNARWQVQFRKDISPKHHANAAVNLKANASTPDLPSTPGGYAVTSWFLIWDPTQSPRGIGGELDTSQEVPEGRAANGVAASQPIATRPLAIRKDGTPSTPLQGYAVTGWYTYGWDLTKNICEIYGQQGYIRTIYRYSPYGTVIAEGNVEQVIQWSSEYYDSETALVYYKTADGCKAGWTCAKHAPRRGETTSECRRINYRYYNPLDGRWTRRDLISILNLMEYCLNAPISFYDVLGAWVAGTQAGAESTDWRGHSDMGQLPGMDYAKEDFGENGPFKKTGLHFMNLVEVEPMLLEAVKSCNKDSFESNMHRMQDFFSHYSQGYRWPETFGHFFQSSYPDNPDAHKEQFDLAISRTEQWERRWLTCCCRKKDGTWTRRDENDQQCGGITIPSNDYKIEPSIGEINWNASQYEEKAMHEAYKEMIRRNNTNIKNNAERMEESIRKVPINVKYTHPWYGL